MSNERMDYESRRALVFQAATEIAETGQVPSLEAVKLKVGVDADRKLSHFLV